MDKFKAIYKILLCLEKSIDIESPDWRQILSPEALGITEPRFTNILRILSEGGYITGIQVQPTAMGGHRVGLFDPAITLQGLEYLANNHNMENERQVAQGIK